MVYRWALLVFVAALLMPMVASAGPIARHERIVVKPRKVKGKPGFRLTVVMRPTDLTKAQLGIGVTAVRQQQGDAPAIRKMVLSENPNFLRLMFPKVSLTANKPMKLEYDVAYGVGNKLKKGDVVDVFSRWKTTWGDGNHIFGVFDGGGHSRQTVTLP